MDLKKKEDAVGNAQDAKDTSTELSPEPVAVDVHLTTLKVFADQNALKYGVEIMAGFYHEQEAATHFADTEENWNQLMNEFKTKEVK
jgi:hypothetical protein